MNTKRKFSELIREGAKIRPQCTRHLFDWVETGEWASCAIGAAWEAMTGDATDTLPDSWDAVSELFAKQGVTLPPHFFSFIVQKNDYDKLTREQIADWLESEGY